MWARAGRNPPPTHPQVFQLSQLMLQRLQWEVEQGHHAIQVLSEDQRALHAGGVHAASCTRSPHI